MRLSTRNGRRSLASSPLGASGRSLVAAAGGALALLAGTATAAPLERTAATPAAPGLRDTILREPVRTLLFRAAADVWGGTYTTSTGEMVRVFASDAYAPDTSFNQVRAEMIARLPHGSEIRSLTAYFLTFAEMQSVCGRQALACYSPREQTIVTIGEDAPDGTSAESILTHEYGHHVARNRVNPPWTALDWGTKRWASYLNVCARVRGGEMFPGDPLRYELDPAEGFAEAYRVMAEVRAGKPAVWLGIVSTIFQPDAGAAAALERDVLAPWTANTTLTRSGSVTATGAARTRSFRIATPLDGIFRVTVRPPARASLRLSITVPGGEPLGRAAAGVRTVQTRICGQRSVVVGVERARGAGAFRLSMSRP
jgi:hypothetical protein